MKFVKFMRGKDLGMNEGTYRMLLTEYIIFTAIIAVLFSLTLLIVIYGNIRNSPLTNGRIKLIQYLTISNLLAEGAHLYWALLALPPHLNDSSSTLEDFLQLIVYFALYAAIIFGLFLGLNLCIFLFQLSINRRVYYFPREILARWHVYVSFAILIPFLSPILGSFFDYYHNCSLQFTMRYYAVILSIMFNVLAFLSLRFLSPQWIQSDLSDQDRISALSLVNKYFVPALLWYPLCEAICQAPYLFGSYYFDCVGPPQSFLTIFLLVVYLSFSYPATSIAHLILFIRIEKPEFSWRILLQRLNMLWIIELPNFLLHVPPNNLNQAVHLYEAMDDENADNEALNRLNQLISRTPLADSETKMAEAA